MVDEPQIEDFLLNRLQKANAAGLFSFAVLSIIYGIIDYEYHPRLMGDPMDLIGGFLTSAALFYAAWSYLSDARLDNEREKKFESLKKTVEKLRREAATHRKLGVRVFTQSALSLLGLLVRSYLLFKRSYRAVLPVAL